MLFNLIKTTINECRKLKKQPALCKFIKHNEAIFPHDRETTPGKPVVLFEFNASHSAHIAYSYLANVLAVANRAHIKAYPQRAHNGWRQRWFFALQKAIGGESFAVYKSFGCNEFLKIVLSPQQKKRAANLFADAWGRLRSKQDIESLMVNEVWIGDLVYDSYLRNYNQPTIDKDSADFKCSMLESMELFVFWEDYLDNHDVRAINVSHCVYNLAIPLRIAVQRDIPVYQANATHLYRLSAKNLFAYNDFVNFAERFAALPAEVREAGLAEAKSRVQRRFSGEVGVDMAYSSKSAYGEFRHSRLLRESSRKKILIATHCFFDSPHSYGNNIFPDFYEWLDFLGRMTEKTDYDWYIKTHPDYLSGTKEIIDSFVAKYPKFTLLPADASHHQIIAEGIDCALTVYGTIGFEYAALGIPVINASQNNPHIAYDFNLHAKDAEDYGRLLESLETLEFCIDKQQVYEYYFMRYIYNTEDMFFSCYRKTIEELGGYKQQFTPVVYEKWLDEWSAEKHQEIVSAISSFVHSGDFRMSYTHFANKEKC